MAHRLKRIKVFWLPILLFIFISGCAPGGSSSGSGSGGSSSGSGSDNDPGNTPSDGISYSPNPVVSSAIIALRASEFDKASSSYSWSVAGKDYDETSDVLIWQSPGLPGTYLVEATVSDGSNDASFDAKMAVSSLNQWPFFRGSLHGLGSKTGIDTSETLGQEKWSLQFSDGYAGTENYVSGVAIANDGSYYVASSKQDSTNDIELSKLSADGSKVIWQLPKDDPSSDISDHITGTPVIDKDGVVYVSSRDQHLYAINPDSSQKWRFNLGNTAWAAPTLGADGTIYIGTATELNAAQIFYAVNSNGTEKWRFDVSNDIRASANIGADGTIYVRVIDGSLYALNPDGSQKWLFKENVGGSGASPVIAADGTIYFGDFDSPGNLYAINPDGTKKWEIALSGGIGATPVVGSDGVIYATTWGRYVHAINPDGTQKWQSSQLAWPIQSSPALGSDGTVYVAVRQQALLYALNTSDGSERWNYQVCSPAGGAGFAAPLSISPQGDVLVHCNDGALYAIE